MDQVQIKAFINWCFNNLNDRFGLRIEDDLNEYFYIDGVQFAGLIEAEKRLYIVENEVKNQALAMMEAAK